MRHTDIHPDTRVRLTPAARRRYGITEDRVYPIFYLQDRPGYKVPLVRIETIGYVKPSDLRPA